MLDVVSILWHSKIIHDFGRTNGLFQKKTTATSEQSSWVLSHQRFLTLEEEMASRLPPHHLRLASFQIQEQPPGGGYLYRTTLVFHPGSSSTISNVNEATEVQWHPHPILPKLFCMIKTTKIPYLKNNSINRYITYPWNKGMPLTKSPIQLYNPCHDWLDRLVRSFLTF